MHAKHLCLQVSMSFWDGFSYFKAWPAGKSKFWKNQKPLEAHAAANSLCWIPAFTGLFAPPIYLAFEGFVSQHLVEINLCIHIFQAGERKENVSKNTCIAMQSMHVRTPDSMVCQIFGCCAGQRAGVDQRWPGAGSEHKFCQDPQPADW